MKMQHMALRIQASLLLCIVAELCLHAVGGRRDVWGTGAAASQGAAAAHGNVALCSVSDSQHCLN
jgi:hypothetical protein